MKIVICRCVTADILTKSFTEAFLSRPILSEFVQNLDFDCLVTKRPNFLAKKQAIVVYSSEKNTRILLSDYAIPDEESAFFKNSMLFFVSLHRKKSSNGYLVRNISPT